MNEEKHLLLPMDLQFFADEPNSDKPTLEIQTNLRIHRQRILKIQKMKIQTEKKPERLLPVMM